MLLMSLRCGGPEAPVPPAHPVIRLSGDGADLIDAFLEDAEGVVAAGSFVP